MIYDAIIIGGGPAGLMAANQFEKSNTNYLLLEKNEKCGKKLLLTGGRRCNVTNHLPVPNFIDTLTLKHRRFLYHALTQFGTGEIISFFKTNGLELVLEDNFKYFPITEKSLSVLEALMKNLKNNHIKYHQNVKEIHYADGIYEIICKEDIYKAKNILVATGSNSFPSTGSSGDGLLFAKHLNINYSEFTPAETHVYSKDVKTYLSELQGASLSQKIIKIKQLKMTYQGDFIITHFGLSGPGIMHLAEFIDQDIRTNSTSIVEISFVDFDAQTLYSKLNSDEHMQLNKCLEQYTTKRIVEVLLKHMHIEPKKIIEMKNKDLIRVCETFSSFALTIDKVEDKEKAYVNKGGIDIKALDPKSMNVKAYKGLYFIGEVTDLHGPIGGYNITIALSTGHLASNHVIRNL